MSDILDLLIKLSVSTLNPCTLLHYILLDLLQLDFLLLFCLLQCKLKFIINRTLLRVLLNVKASLLRFLEHYELLLNGALLCCQFADALVLNLTELLGLFLNSLVDYLLDLFLV